MDLLNGKPVCFLSGNEFLPKKGITFANQVENFFVLQGSMANSPFGVVDLDNKGVQNSKQHGIGRIKAASFAAIKDVLEKGEIILPLGEYKVHGKKQITGMIAAPIQIDKEKYVCVVMVIANLEQKRLYVHESFLTKNLQEIVASNSVRGSNASSPQPQGDVAKVLQNYLIDKQNVENNNIKENKNMNKNKIRLTESQLHRVIKESVKKVLRELDYKTYQNAAKKAHLRALDDYDDNDTNMNKYLEKSKNFRNAAEDAFIRDYGYDDGQYHTKMHSDMHGSNAKAPGGGYFPYHDDSSLRIYDRNDKFNILGIPHERSVARDDYIKKMIIPFCTTFWNVLNAEYDLSRLNIRILSQMFL